MKEWDYEENNKIDLTPKTISYGSAKKAYWICSKDKKHKWFSSIGSRTGSNAGCPYCAGKFPVIGENDLASQKPRLASEWHPTKNGDLKPTDITVGSGKKVWWLCSICGNEWQSTVDHRVNGRNCPECNKKGISFPELAIYYYLLLIYLDCKHKFKYSDIEFDVFIPSIQTAIEFDGSHWHKDKIETDNKKDIFCKNNNIRLIRIRGNLLPPTTLAEIIWVKDKDNTDLNLAIINLLNLLNLDCSFEINVEKDMNKILNLKKIKGIENSIVTTHPEVSTQWHPTKNGSLKPESFSHGSGIVVWWKCPKCGYEWKSSVYNKINSSCPFCGKKHIWTEKEIEILRKYYPTEGIKVIEKLPYLSKTSIEHKVQRLGIKFVGK